MDLHLHDKSIRHTLLEWYSRQKRPLPWRKTRDAYKIWVSEIMLQQTQVVKVIAYYENFINIFPTVSDLAATDLERVLKAWEGMGYYARARNLHKSARIIRKEYHGRFPSDIRVIRDLPGIGPYTAAAIASIAFDFPAPVLDGNVNRVLSRLTVLPHVPKSPAGKKILEETALVLLDKNDPGSFNQAMMELGALVCTPRSPDCAVCPLSTYCQAYQQAKTGIYPLRAPKRERPHHIITAGIIWKGDKILITRRPERGLLGGLWEFPGGKVENNETPEQAVKREIKEEVDVTVSVGDRFAVVEHGYTHFSITLNVFHCRYKSGTPKAIGCTDWIWVEPQALTRYAFPRANGKVIEKLLEKGPVTAKVKRNSG